MSPEAPAPDAAAVRARAAAFARDEIAPFAAEWDRNGHIPRSIVWRLGELGFLTGPLPVALGGSGFDHVTSVGVYEEIGRACSSVRGFLAVHTGLVSQCLGDHAREDQRRCWLPRLGTGEWVGCFALTEEEAGSDVGALSTTATRKGGVWTLTGAKTWITNGSLASLALVFARTGPGKGKAGLTAFVVELPAKGWEARPFEHSPLGHRAADHARIVLDGLQVPDEQRLGAVGDGFAIAMSALDHGRLGVAAGAVGLARACLGEAVLFAQQRRQFGRRIGDFQMVQADLADMSAETEAAAALVVRAARAADEDSPDTRRLVCSAKLFATEAAQRAADKAVLLLGSRGYDDTGVVARCYRDIQGLRIYEGTNHIQRLVIARTLLGPP